MAKSLVHKWEGEKTLCGLSRQRQQGYQIDDFDVCEDCKRLFSELIKADTYPPICPYPHTIKGTVFVYSRELFEMYSSGEIDLPLRCFCGELLEYALPLSIALMDGSEPTGEVLLRPDSPPNNVNLYLAEEER